MIIMGVDPGLSSTGYGVIEARGDRARSLGFGGISTPAGMDMSERLAIIFAEAEELLRRFRPEVMAVEQLFFSSNARSAMLVGEALGVILLAAQRAGVKVREYTPLQVKMALVGNGRADKRQIDYMVRAVLSIEGELPSSHAADALALAVCHLHSSRLEGRLGAER